MLDTGGATINLIKETSGARVKVSSNSETFPGKHAHAYAVKTIF